MSATRPTGETSQKWRCAFLVVTLLLAAGAAFEGRWASAIGWLFFAGLWALSILLELRETSQKWRCAFLVVTLLLAAGAAFEGRWASAIGWLFFAGIWALLILLEWKKGRNQP